MVTKTILVFNVGSSSIKYSLFENTEKIETGNYERLKTKEDYKDTIEKIFEKLKNKKIDIIAHRVVHGGDLNHPAKISKSVKNKIEEFAEFAPLHNPKQLMVIELAEKYCNEQYAVFDTMFFADLPEVARTYAIPKGLTKQYNIRRYGFHGFSHEFVSKNLKGKTITCHLGAGSSISAIIEGKPVDTSMGLTPLEGLIMGTRSGTIDPGLVLFLEKKEKNANEILTEKSGLKGICGHNDFRDVLENKEKDPDSKLAYEMFVYQIVKIVGSYVAVLNGVDNLIFTAGIGEHSWKMRRDVCKHFEYLGLKIDEDKNKNSEEIISSSNSKVKVLVIPTNEEKMIVEEVLKSLK